MNGKDLIKRSRLFTTIYRFLDEAVDIKKLVYLLPNGIYYVWSLVKYRRALKNREKTGFEWYPQIHDRTATTKVDPHYFYQGYWAFERILSRKPEEHYDVGSQIDFVRYLSAVIRVIFIDIRPIELPLPNLKCVNGSILSTGYPDNSVSSISSLHVIEHIGLGRYGDPIDPDGSAKAAREMMRMLAPGGRLYISTPVGRPRVCFNAHLIRTPQQVVDLFAPLELVEFSIVGDDRRFIENADITKYDNSAYACGMFVFTKSGKCSLI